MPAEDMWRHEEVAVIAITTTGDTRYLGRQIVEDDVALTVALDAHALVSGPLMMKRGVAPQGRRSPANGGSHKFNVCVNGESAHSGIVRG